MTSVQQTTPGSTAEKNGHPCVNPGNPVFSCMTAPVTAPNHGHPCVNPGNPVFSCMTAPVTAPNHIFQAKQRNVLFKTSSSEYEMAPCSHHPVSQRFSQHLGQCGMYRNHSFNTMVDRSRVHDCPNLQYTL
ncbi:hypothetical protein XELAEV_18018184mg [Xenopus laevis]|uniref:Uncharacterized protein n=1 Tax=Xenopus laevis TaxID=8355 RepID=A0A974DFA3_XENLA|nr:hypothetical protein XELAEV_18018184mg [Xenopus laevis]